jgi:hypothetical protein
VGGVASEPALAWTQAATIRPLIQPHPRSNNGFQVGLQLSFVKSARRAFGSVGPFSSYLLPSTMRRSQIAFLCRRSWSVMVASAPSKNATKWILTATAHRTNGEF